MRIVLAFGVGKHDLGRAMLINIDSSQTLLEVRSRFRPGNDLCNPYIRKVNFCDRRLLLRSLKYKNL